MSEVEETERWFVRQGLPFFVEGRSITVDALVHGRSLAVLVLAYFGSLLVAVPADEPWPERLLFAGLGLLALAAVWVVANLARRQRALERPRRVGAVEVAVFTLGPAAAVAVLRQDAEMVLTLVLADVTVLGVVAAAEVLDAAPIARWALSRTFRELSSLFRLVTRALPMLLLFMTFLFINTEVWMVADSLDNGVLAMAVMFFAALAVAFLLVRLPEEMDRVDDDVDPDRLVQRCQGTPLGSSAAEVFGAADQDDLPDLVEVTGLQKWNLVLVLLVSQSVQVLLLSVAVLVFFVGFGSVVMQPDVVGSWLGRDVTNVTGPLVKVSVFLAGFSGLYFTVYAVTDDTYRQQFFTSVTRELERAVAVRAVYRTLRR